MSTQVLWQGHEVDSFIIGNSQNSENTFAREAAYARTGMVVGTTTNGGSLTTSPDWVARDEIWYRFNYGVFGSAAYQSTRDLWSLKNAAGTVIAKLSTISTTQIQFFVWNGNVFVAVGDPITLSTVAFPHRWDIHFKGGADGVAQVWYGSIGSQTQVLNVTGDFSAATGNVRVTHLPIGSAGAGSNAGIAQALAQTTSTLASVTESKWPTSNGSDLGGVGAYTEVDEQIYSDADVVTLSATGDRHSFKANARTAVLDIVTGVTISCRAWYETGGPTQIKPYLLIGGTRYYGTTMSLGLVASAYQYTWTTNPATGVPFTTAEAASATLEWGWEAV
jgi:hypothetical protein